MTSRRMTAGSRMFGAMALLLALGAAPAARGQCDVFRDGFPDFDQMRAALPSTGNMYCVPTSACDLVGYIATHGDGTVFVYGGMVDFQQPVYYDPVTSDIALMGSKMSTSASNGTSGDNARSGLQSFLNNRHSGVYTVSSTFGHVRSIDLFDKMGDGRLVMVCYGYYGVDGSGHYSRNGGHCVALTGVAEACGGSTVARLRYRDPDDDGTLNSQSVFSSKVTNAMHVVLSTSSGNIDRLRLTSLGVGSTTLRCLDTVISIRTTFAVWPHPTLGRWDRAWLGALTNVQGGLLAQFATGNGKPIVGSVLTPDGAAMVYMAMPTVPSAPTPVYRQSLTDGTSTLLTTVPFTTAMAMDRFGNLYLHVTGQTKRFDISSGVAVQTGGFTPNDGQYPDFLACDDANDQLVIVTQSARTLLLYNRSLALLSTHTLPAAVPSSTGLCGDVAPSPTAGQTAYVLATTSSNMLFDLRIIPAQTLLGVAQSLAVSGAASIKSVQIGDDGRMFVMTNVGDREFVRNASSGLWEPASGPALFASVPASSPMLISRGRSNYDPAINGVPGWQNVVVAEPTPGAIRDCAADANLDGVLSVADIFAFLNRWFASSRGADFNVSGTLSVLDIFDFLNAWFAGCP